MVKNVKGNVLLMALAAALALFLTSCGGSESEPSRSMNVGEQAQELGKAAASGDGGESGGGSGKAAEGSEMSGFNINRKTRSEVSPMGEDGTWTIFVYLCGSDLESDGNLGSVDIQEMIKADTGDNVRFVVQTGGASSWYYEIEPDALERYVITGGEAELVDSQPGNSMGDGATLAAFLKWGVENYPAEKMGLILWDHGGGSIHGVCFDELYDRDGLLLKDIDAALYSVYDHMTSPFAFVGFDACLMSTVEAAAMMATHAEYMIGSQETEPGYGWNYEVIGDYLGEHPEADALSLGKVICDAFYSDCEEINSEKEATLSVIDLSKMDELLTKFNLLAEEVYNYNEQGGTYTGLARDVASADNFGANNRSEGYTNMVDLGGLVEAFGSVSDVSGEVVKAIEDAVAYNVRGRSHKDACGMSIYYPLCLMGNQELKIFRDVCISTWYLGLVDKVAYGAVNGGDFEDYENSSSGSSFLSGLLSAGDWGDESYDYDEETDTYSYSPEEDTETGSVWDYLQDYEPSGESSAITFEQEPSFDEDGNYGFVLDEAGLANTESVECYISLELGDEYNAEINLGTSGDVLTDWETGEFYDNFDGYWFSLPDDQPLMVTLVEDCGGYDIYTAPILLNGEETNLRFIWDYEEGSAWIEGVWGGLDDYGASDRNVVELEEGDEIVPQYEIWMYDDEGYYEDDTTFEGDPYTYDGDNGLVFSMLEDGTYSYGFYINDIYGDYYTSYPVSFTIDGEDIYFEE